MLIDEFHAGVMDELERFLNNEGLRGHGNVLIDGAFVPRLHQEFGAEVGEADVHVLFKPLPGADADILDVSPFLVHLEFLTPKIRTLLRRCSGWPMLSLIESSEPPSVMAARLASWCIVASDGLRFNFRFADTRRLPAIVETLNTAQLGSMFGSAREINCISRYGDWQKLHVPGEARDIAPSPQSITPDQFSKLVKEGEVDVIIGRLKGLGYMSDWKRSTQFLHVAQAVNAAAARTLTEEETFAWCKASFQFEFSSPTAIDAHLQEWCAQQRKIV